MSAEMFELIACLSVDLLLDLLLWPLLFGCFGSAAAAIFGEVVGGCGHTFVQDAGKEPFKMSLSLLVIVCFFSPFSHVQKHTHIQIYLLCTLVRIYLSATVCVCCWETQGGKSNAVAMESYPWCRNYGNKAWKASDLIGISEALCNCDPE